MDLPESGEVDLQPDASGSLDLKIPLHAGVAILPENASDCEGDYPNGAGASNLGT